MEYEGNLAYKLEIVFVTEISNSENLILELRTPDSDTNGRDKE